jgi:Family of unknown function (DUF6081)
MSADWTVHDTFEGPDFDLDRWSSGNPPLPGGGVAPLEPDAQVAVGEGVLTVSIPRFTRSDDSFQSADNVKFLYFSEPVDLTEAGPVTFAVDLKVRNHGGDPSDVRLGMATLNVVDLGTGLVFDICGTESRLVAIHEGLPFLRGPEGAFTHTVMEPFARVGDLREFRTCEITLDRGAGSAAWSVDGEGIYKVENTEIPSSVALGFGIFTIWPIEDGVSRCLRGQGLEASWRLPRYRRASRRKSEHQR